MSESDGFDVYAGEEEIDGQWARISWRLVDVAPKVNAIRAEIAELRENLRGVTRERNAAMDAHVRDLQEMGVRIDEARAERNRVREACNVLVDALSAISRMSMTFPAGERPSSRALVALHAARDAAREALDNVPMYLTERTVKA